MPDTFEHVCACGRSIECELYEALEAVMEVAYYGPAEPKGTAIGMEIYGNWMRRIKVQAEAALAKYKEKERWTKRHPRPN